MTDGNDGTFLGDLVPDDIRDLLRGRSLILSRPAHGRRHGRHASRRAGMGLDFRDHRAYAPGDEPRLLDWRAVARRDRLILRQTESEDELDLVLLLDGSAAMDYGSAAQNKARVAAAFAASLAWLAIRQGDRIGFARGAAGDFQLESLGGRGRTRLSPLLRALTESPTAGVCPWPELVRAVEPRLPRRSLVVLLSDFLDPAGHHGERAHDVEQEWLQDLGRLRARGHDVALLQIFHRDELDFPWREGRMYRFEDARGNRVPVEAPGSHLRRGYLERLRRHLDWLRGRCEQSGLLLHAVTTDESLADALIAFLGRVAGRGDANHGLDPGVIPP